MHQLKSASYRLGTSSTAQSIVFVIVLLLVAIASHVQWFNPGSILEFGDWQYRPDEHVRQLLTSWNTWVPFNNLGEANILISGFPFRGIAWSLITNLGLSYDIATKLTLFIPVALGGFLAPYLLARHLFKDNVVAFVVSLFYGTTAYFLILQTTHLPIAIVYVLLPILVYWLHRALDENKLYLWLLLSLSFCVGVFYEVRIMYILTFVLLGYIFWFIWAYKKNIKQYIVPACISAGLVVLINVFWLLPTKFIGTESINDVASRGLFGDALFNLSTAFNVMKWSWTGGMVDTSFTPQPVPIYFWIVPLLAFAGLIFAKAYRKQILFFLSVTLIGVFLTKQSAEPFATAYTWLYDHFPGFVLFREASKFYVLVAFGYFGLIAFSVLGLKQKAQTLKKYQYRNLWRAGYATSLLLIVVVSFANLLPAFAGELGGTFKNASMPEDYKKLKSFITSQPEYFRTYWVPRESWWGYYDNQHPKVRGTDMIEKSWRKYIVTPGGSGFDIAKNNVEIFKQPFSKNLFGSASIKYVIVPLRDSQNFDDFFPSYGDDKNYFIDELNNISFLKRIDSLGLRDIAVFENLAYEPYVSTTNRLTSVSPNIDISEQSGFIASNLDSGIALSDGQAAAKLTTLFDASGVNISDAGLTDKLTGLKNARLYADTNTRTVEYRLNNNYAEFYLAPSGSLRAGDKELLSVKPRQLLTKVPLASGVEYLLAAGENLIPTALLGDKQVIGTNKENDRLLHVDSDNLVPNSSFELGLWKEHVSDCNDFDGDSKINMQLSNDSYGNGEKSLELSAFKHTACTSTESIAVQPGSKLRFGIDFKTDGAPRIGYKLSFNDPDHTVVSNILRVKDQQWRSLDKLVQTPNGANKVTIELYGYSGADSYKYAITRYDNVRLMELIEDVRLPSVSPKLETLAVDDGDKVFIYQSSAEGSPNLIPNPSLESGLWQEKVGDCNNYDDKPQIEMVHSSQASDGKKSLQLKATRHIACTSPGPINVEGQSDYLLSFDVTASNTKNINYTLRFNDSLKTIESKQVQLGSGWTHYKTSIHIPLGASQLQMTLYAQPNDEGSHTVTTIYDNFRMMLLPDIETKYHIVNNTVDVEGPAPNARLAKNSPTKKTISVESASKPFFVTVSEAYHSGWEVTSATHQSLLESIVPIPNGNVLGSQHFEANSGINAWYIDPLKICSEADNACTKNADGTYGFELNVEFAPQRWFYIGLIISGSAFIVTVLVLSFLLIRKYRSSQV